MPLIIPPGYADIAAEMLCQGDPDPWYCTWGVDSSAATGDPEDIGHTSITAWTIMMSQLSPECQFTGVKVTIGQDGAENIRQFVPVDAATPGTSNVPKLPQNNAVLIRKTSAVGGRRARGRLFVPNMATEGSVSNVGLIAGDVRAAYQGFATQFLNSLAENAIPTPMVILHNSLGISPIIDPTPVTSLVVDQTISTQRRRLR